MTLDYVAMRAPDDPDMTMMIYSASPGSATATALQLLAGLTTPLTTHEYPPRIDTPH
jgi:hypothetical protein